MALTAIRTENELLYSQIPTITRESINSIKMYLTIKDKMSLIFLLFDDSMAETALQFAIQLANKAPLDVLDEWISYVYVRETKWQFILVEALSVIRQYSALRTLGFSSLEIDSQFLPTSKKASMYIPLKRKILYQLLDTFNEEKMNLFLETVRKHFEIKNFIFKRYEYVEMYLLYWTSMKYISTEYLENISRTLKVVEIDAKGPLKLPCMHFLHCVGNCLGNKSSVQENRVKNSYVIDPKCPGICLIINQQNFYIEYDNLYQNPLPPLKFTRRTGTDIDKNRLIDTFTNLKYEVIVQEDLTHSEMKEIIESVVQSIKNHSSLFICILSHGSKGQVYGVDSIPIKIEVIKEIMCTKNERYLQGKPKVLILQACQTKLRFEVDENVEDMYATNKPASTPDLLVFYATIPGFGAVRDMLKGAWFIQSFCDQMENKENLNCNFDDICTLVQGEVTNMKSPCSKRTMIPMKTSTFTKFLHFPRL